MPRPTIPDLARSAGVSRATVNRVLNTPDTVRPATRQRVADAAAEIGFYGLEALQHRLAPSQKPFRLRVFLQQPNGWFCECYAAALREIRDEMGHRREIRMNVEHLTDLSPEAISDRIATATPRADAIAVMAAEHPLLTAAIETATTKGIAVYAVITSLSAPSLAGYVGLDGNKVGRTAAWTLHRLCKSGGKIGILVGSPRYRIHEAAEIGFRSYFREHDPTAQILEPLSTFESDGIAREVTEKLLRKNPDLTALYLTAGGTKGALAALRACGRAKDIATIAYDLTDETRRALLDGTVDLVISHPFTALARATLDLILTDASTPQRGRTLRFVDFKVFTPENI